MMEEKNLNELQKEWHGSLRAYIIGFTLSVVLTIASFFLVMANVFPQMPLILSIVALGLLQAVVQLLFFLHLGQESKPRWEFFIFLFMVGVLLIIVLGSLWIMYDLNHRVMEGMMG